MSFSALERTSFLLVSKSRFSKTVISSIPRAYASSVNQLATEKRRPSQAAAHPTLKDTQHPSRKAAVNPPVSALPPILAQVERQPDQTTAAYYFSIGKSYISFYKTALKAVWTNSRQARAMMAGIPTKDSQGHSISLLRALNTGSLTRADFQFILRSRKDIKKLPLVGLLVAICGEFTPLLVVFVSGIIPRTVWIPKQVHRARVNTETRRAESFRQGTVENDAELKRISLNEGIEGLSSAQILHISRALGLHSTLWEKLWDRPPRWIARMRARRALEYLKADDLAIQRDGGVQALSDAETERACEERGLDVLKFNIKDLRNRLALYMRFRNQKKTSVAALVLVRPSSWEKLV